MAQLLDPLLWDPTTFCLCLYDDTEPWNYPGIDRPDQNDFLDALNRFHMTGRIFLTTGDINPSGQDIFFSRIGIEEPEHVLWLLNAIQHLKARSDGYHKWKKHQTTSLRAANARRLSATPSQLAVSTPRHDSPAPFSLPPSALHRLATHTQSQSETPLPVVQEVPSFTRTPVPQPTRIVSLPPTDSDTSVPAPSAHKRPAPLDLQTSVQESLKNATSHPSEPTLQKKLKRVAPTLIQEITKEPTPNADVAFCVSFFGSGPYTLKRRLPEFDNSDSELEDEEFCHVTHKHIPPALRWKAYQAVSGILNHKSDVRDLQQATSDEEESFIVDSPDESKVIFREDSDGSSPPLMPDTTKFLAAEDIDKVVDERIEYFVQIFNYEKLPKLKRQAYNIWNEGRAERLIGHRLRAAYVDLGHMNQRLESMREQIKVTQWTSWDQLWHQTNSLDLTVYDRERSQWLINILKGPCPKKKVRSTKKPADRQLKRDYVPSDSEGEIIESSDDGFIMDDMLRQPESKKRPGQPDFLIPPARSQSAPSQQVLSEAGRDLSGFIAQPPSLTSPISSLVHTASEVANEPKPKSEDESPMAMVDSDNQVVKIENHLQTISDEDTVITEAEVAAPVVRIPSRFNPRRFSNDITPENNFTTPRAFWNSSQKTPASEPRTSQESKWRNTFPIIISDSEDETENLPAVSYDLSQWKEVPQDFRRIFPKPVLDKHGNLARVMVAAIYFMSTSLRLKIFKLFDNAHGNENDFWTTAVVGSKSDMVVQIALIGLFGATTSGKVVYHNIEKFKSSQYIITTDLNQHYKMKPIFFEALLDISREFPTVVDEIVIETESQEDDNVSGLCLSLDKAKKRCITKNSNIDFEERMRREQERWDHKVELAKRSLAQASALAMAGSQSRLIINLSKCEDEPFILIPTSIVRATPEIFDTQVEGIRFIWDNVIANDGLVSSNGCMLAHTMGLGKTMQVISLLLAVVEATHSSNPRVRTQIPVCYHRNRFLIICPAPLCDNWTKEFDRWAGDSIMPHVQSLQDMHKEERQAAVHRWSQNSGVMVLSYTLFAREYTKQSELHKLLIENADIVVADEAHTINNKSSQNREACDSIMTTARIALTGSPMANNTLEYFQMVDWIAPGYIGTEQEFRNTYAKPIEDANVNNANQATRYLARKLLTRLSKKLRHKVNRATLKSLPTHVLPSKKEYIIAFPPKKGLQSKLYSEYVRLFGQNCLISDFGALDNLSLILTHPKCFAMKLRGVIDGYVDPDQENSVRDRETLTPQMSAALLNIIDKYHDLEDIDLSWRVHHIITILDECRHLKEKVLLFSQYLDVLNYFQDLFERENRKFCRIDGSTKARVDLVRRFNNSDLEVFLISTKAGGTGLNIQGASRIILCDFKYNPMWEQQAIGRAYRINQKRPVFVYRFFADGSSEAHMLQRAVFKIQLTDAVVDDQNAVPRSSFQKGSNVKALLPPKYRPYDNYLGQDTVLDSLLKRPSAKEGVCYVDHTDTFAEPEEDIDVPPELMVQISHELKTIEVREKHGGVTLQNAAAPITQTETGTRIMANNSGGDSSKPAETPYHLLPTHQRLRILLQKQESSIWVNLFPITQSQLPLDMDGNVDEAFKVSIDLRTRATELFRKAEVHLGLLPDNNKQHIYHHNQAACLDDHVMLFIRGDFVRRAREKLLLELLAESLFAVALLYEIFDVTIQRVSHVQVTDRELKDLIPKLKSMSWTDFYKKLPTQVKIRNHLKTTKLPKLHLHRGDKSLPQVPLLSSRTSYASQIVSESRYCSESPEFLCSNVVVMPSASQPVPVKPKETWVPPPIAYADPLNLQRNKAPLANQSISMSQLSAPIRSRGLQRQLLGSVGRPPVSQEQQIASFSQDSGPRPKSQGPRHNDPSNLEVLRRCHSGVKGMLSQSQKNNKVKDDLKAIQAIMKRRRQNGGGNKGSSASRNNGRSLPGISQ